MMEVILAVFALVLVNVFFARKYRKEYYAKLLFKLLAAMREVEIEMGKRLVDSMLELSFALTELARKLEDATAGQDQSD